ncbi:hypothetical protein, partial [Oceanicoccus sp.]|uniref:hypothetical protein n=1 Tax=Oceanicoccus sp. TaxID=2691044 RepID=UPI00260BD201
ISKNPALQTFLTFQELIACKSKAISFLVLCQNILHFIMQCFVVSLLLCWQVVTEQIPSTILMSKPVLVSANFTFWSYLTVLLHTNVIASKQLYFWYLFCELEPWFIQYLKKTILLVLLLSHRIIHQV